MISRPKLLLALPLAFALFGMAQTANATETMVDQKGLQFAPNAVTIKVGDTLHFLNSDHFKHDVTIENPDGTILDKGLMDFKKDLVVDFPKPGTYKVHCRLHPTMKMVITVN